MDSAPIILVPGFWLGAWAWDEVAAVLRDDGHDVTALTLPGLDSASADRSSVTFADHVDAICNAVIAAGVPVVLAVHSGAGFPGYAATDRVPDSIAAVVYVDTGPGKGAMKPDATEDLGLAPWDELGENLDGLTEEHLATFRSRAVPQPAGVLREGAELTDDARLAIPSTVVCTSSPSEEVKAWADEGYEFLAGLSELRDVRWVDLPTSHWPMWSRPRELAGVISDVATRHAGG
jgi:pimeloyl-ACP methyl ester carboxylesterase